MKSLLCLLAMLFAVNFSYAQNTFPTPSGNVGIGTTSPSTALQIGDFGYGSSNNQLLIPGTYNFEQVRLGQIGNGNSALEFVNHTSTNPSYGIKLLVSTDIIPGLQLQYAPSATSYSSLNYTTGFYMNLLGNIGIGTINPVVKTEISGAGTTQTSLLRLNVTGSPTGGSGGAIEFGSQVNTSNSFAIAKIGNYLQNGGAGNEAGDLTFSTVAGGIMAEHMRLSSSGNLGIGTTTPDQKLTVNGTIHGTEIKVDLSVPAPDYVFEKSYKLKSLQEVAKYISINKHLSEIPSAKVMEQNGVNVSEMNMKLLQKVEELTLYLINEHEEKETQQQVIQSQQSQIDDLRRQVETLLKKKS